MRRLLVVILHESPGSVGVAILEVAGVGSGFGIPDVAPVLGSVGEALADRGLAETIGERGDAELGGYIFEGVGGWSPGRCAYGNVVELQPLVEAGALAGALDGTAGGAEVVGGGVIGGLH